MAGLVLGPDHPWLAHRLGFAGKVLEEALRSLAGRGRFGIPLLLSLLAVKVMRERESLRFSGRDWGLVIGYLVLLTGLHLPWAQDNPMIPGQEGQGGGTLGAVLVLMLVKAFGQLGTYMVLAALGLVSFLLVTDLSLVEGAGAVGRRVRSVGPRLRTRLEQFLFEEEKGEGEAEEPSRSRSSGQEPPQTGQRARVKGRPGAPPVRTVEAPPVEPAAEDREEETPLVVRAEPTVRPEPQEELPEAEDEPFLLPPLSLLRRASKARNLPLSKEIYEKAQLLEQTLENFGVSVKVTQISCGPTVTRYEVQPAPGVKVSRIISLGDDIALSLAAGGVRIEAPIPGKAAIGIEVPNREVAVVHLREVLESQEFQQSTSKLTIALGKDIAGRPVVADLAKMPHLLIAGATGSGKSVCLNGLICSLLYKARPTELKFMLIDPKMVELTGYNGIPHLLTSVVTDAKKAAAALRWMTTEMDNRYARFAAAGVRDLRRYNRAQRLTGRKPLSYIVVIIDELAELMMVAPAEVEDSICRLAQKARAAGIHLVVATQRPSVDVITGLIKANIPSRIAFAVSSQTDSRTILDLGGAEKLIGRGDMLFFPVGAVKPIRVQGAYVSDREVQNVVNFLRQQTLPEVTEEIVLPETPETGRPEEEDELLPQAVRVLLESGQASISMLQRRLRIGYARAARLIDIMEARGMVSGQDGAKPRSLLIGWDDYYRMFGKAQG
ncbi:MAG: DNA translocase FtsK 4TM domain-containing protein [Clostridia bacterium]|nr:DNA translocase FtsK [Clostridia bacterium]MDH7572941.1 DNA translocase FtsK 4TM domain-containing protein [Clostridia bacterium]